jgi:hypothetical protein
MIEHAILERVQKSMDKVLKFHSKADIVQMDFAGFDRILLTGRFIVLFQAIKQLVAKQIVRQRHVVNIWTGL